MTTDRLAELMYAGRMIPVGAKRLYVVGPNDPPALGPVGSAVEVTVTAVTVLCDVVAPGFEKLGAKLSTEHEHGCVLPSKASGSLSAEGKAHLEETGEEPTTAAVPAKAKKH